MDYSSLCTNGLNAASFNGCGLSGGITFVVFGHTILSCFVIRFISFTSKALKYIKIKSLVQCL